MTDEINVIEGNRKLDGTPKFQHRVEFEKQATESYNLVLSKDSIMKRSQKDDLRRKGCMQGVHFRVTFDFILVLI